jgi:membrane AbrB-like protein
MSAAVETPRRFTLQGRAAPAQWAAMLALSLAFALVFEAMRLPAALLLGPMAGAIVIGAFDGAVRIPRPPFLLAQAVIGCLMARSLSGSVFVHLAHDWPVFLTTVFSVIVASSFLGWLLAYLKVMPGSVAIWGSSPGAATAMTLLAEQHGADIRLVAFMQYTRVVLVAIAATVISRIFMGASGAHPPTPPFFPPLHALALAQTLSLVAASAIVGVRFRTPGGPLLLSMFGGAALQMSGLITIELPPWLLTLSYAAVGWTIGLRFTRPIIAYVGRALPRVALSIVTLIAICGGFAFLLVHIAGIDPLTAYLATSPGGADSVAIIANASNADTPYVVALQAARFLIVLAVGPSIARFVAKRTPAVAVV